MLRKRQRVKHLIMWYKHFQLFLLSFLFVQCYSPNRNNTVISNKEDQPDSIIIIYDRQTSLVCWDEARTYHTFISLRAGFPIEKMKLDSVLVSFLDSCINNAMPDTRIKHDIAVNYLLFRYKGQAVDTIGVPGAPGDFQLRDTVYCDSLIYKAVVNELAKRDSVWLYESNDGASYQVNYLGRKDAVEEHIKKYWLH